MKINPRMSVRIPGMMSSRLPNNSHSTGFRDEKPDPAA